MLLAVSATSSDVLAKPGDQWLLQTSIYTRHYHRNPEHNNHQHLIGLERHWSGPWLAGASFFDNSFNQSTQYVYGGYQFRPLESIPLMHVKITGGVIHGYKGRYRDKIPLNTTGVAPAIVPAIGFSGKHVTGEVNFFGLAGVMFTMGVLF